MAITRLIIVTERRLMQPSFEGALRAALEGGARLIQLREKELSASGVFQSAQVAKQLCDEFGAKLIVNGNWQVAREIHSAGVHLPESNSMMKTRESLGLDYSRRFSFSQSVHSLEAAQNAENHGADFLVFGSVFPTASHAGSTPAGLESLREVTSQISIPVFAIGGISIHNARECLDAGAHGVAVMRAVWDAADVARAVAALNELLAR